MVGQGLIDGMRRIGAILAMLAVATFIMLAAPSHAEPLIDFAAPAAASAHHAGDGDPDAAHHAPGAHCGAHCAGHAAPPLLAMSAIDAGALVDRRRPADDAAPATLSSAPPTRPPSAA